MADMTEAPGPTTLPTSEELAEALKVDVYDRGGQMQTLGDLIRDKRSVLIFTRHFWCLNCQAYVRAISKAIPPSHLPANTQSKSLVLSMRGRPHYVQFFIISNGSYQPIDTYASTTLSLYPIYTDPTCRLHAILKFKSALKEESVGDEKRDYMRDAGSTLSRIFGGVKGAMGNLQHVAYIGPKSLNGGEVVLTADGKCEYIYRMQNTVDHTNVADLTKIIGVEQNSTDVQDLSS